jgi:hypothetical protein
MHREVELVTLYALLHDVGKPIQRFLRRARRGVEKEGVERALKALSEFTEKNPEDLLKTAEQIRHEEITEWVMNALSRWGVQVPHQVKGVIKDVLEKADVMAASERRLGEPYELSTLMYELVRRVFRESGLEIEYEAEYVPLLIPTWMLKVSGYQELVGLKNYFELRYGRRENLVEGFIKVFKEFASEVEVCRSRPEQCNLQTLKEHVKRLLVERVGALIDPMWLPIRAINAKNVLNLEAKKIKDAVESSSYAEIVEEFINKLKALLELYEPYKYGVRKGFIDSLDQLMKYACLLVPSAIYATITPDISLYGHSKLVAAYASSHIASQSGRARLLVIDTNQIQRFISSPQKAGGASRVLRGRSLLVELALDALSTYTLILFDQMPRSNVIISEGGTLDIIVPDLPDFERRIEKIRAVVRDVSLGEFNGRLGFTIAYSRSFNVEELDFLGSLVRGGGFYGVLESLSLNLAMAKSTRLVNEPLYINIDKIVGFDAITREPVLKDDLEYVLGLRLAFKVSEDTIKYADKIAGPRKLNIGDIIGKNTHLSLISGTLARNLVGVIGIYVYRYVDGLPSPDPDVIISITRELAKEICGEHELVCDVERRDIKVGFIPLSKIGALYVLISAKEVKNPLTREYVLQAWSVIASFLQVYADRLVERLKQLKGNLLGVDIKTVNTFLDFVPSSDHDVFSNVKGVIEKLLNLGVNVSFSCTTINPWHPVKEEDGRVELIDLDKYDIISVGKMDCDRLGDVKHLLSYSPSRLLTFSELLNLVLAGKSYLRVFENQELYGDVIALYAGGDDAVFYGDWIPVISYIARVYEDVRKALPPLTFSIGITLDKSDTPLILLYNDAVELLERAKRGSRAACALKLSNPILVPVPSKTTYEFINVIPLESPSKNYPWIVDVTGHWNFSCLARVLEHLYLAEKTPKYEELRKILTGYKRDIYLLSMLGAKLVSVLEDATRDGVVDMSRITQILIPLEIEYAYLWARRGDELRKVNDILSDICREIKILAWPNDVVGSVEGLHTALRALLAAKSILDHILLALRM